MVAERLREQTAITAVALSGGVFLNVLLTRLCTERLQSRDFRVLRHQQVPPSDAGIALGQLVIGAKATTGRSAICV
jgi:hydrogenase maturation protein HypF